MICQRDYCTFLNRLFVQPTGKQLFLSNRAGLEEAFIAAAEKDSAVTEEMAAAIRVASERAAGLASGAVDVSEGLFIDDDDDDLDDEDYLSEGEDDDDDYDDDA